MEGVRVDCLEVNQLQRAFCIKTNWDWSFQDGPRDRTLLDYFRGLASIFEDVAGQIKIVCGLKHILPMSATDLFHSSDFSKK